MEVLACSRPTTFLAYCSSTTFSAVDTMVLGIHSHWKHFNATLLVSLPNTQHFHNNKQTSPSSTGKDWVGVILFYGNMFFIYLQGMKNSFTLSGHDTFSSPPTHQKRVTAFDTHFGSPEAFFHASRVDKVLSIFWVTQSTILQHCCVFLLHRVYKNISD